MLGSCSWWFIFFRVQVFQTHNSSTYISYHTMKCIKWTENMFDPGYRNTEEWAWWRNEQSTSALKCTGLTMFYNCVCSNSCFFWPKSGIWVGTLVPVLDQPWQELCRMNICILRNFRCQFLRQDIRVNANHHLNWTFIYLTGHCLVPLGACSVKQHIERCPFWKCGNCNMTNVQWQKKTATISMQKMPPPGSVCEALLLFSDCCRSVLY